MISSKSFIFLYQGLKRRDSSDSDSSRIGDNKLTNQFSFVERATQTMYNGKKVEQIIISDKTLIWI